MASDTLTPAETPLAAPAITVRAPDKTYPIYIGDGLLAALPELLNTHGLRGKRVIVTNDVLRPIYAEALAQALDAALFSLPDGETYKNLESVSALYDAFIGFGLDRRSAVIALGGGVVGDTVGFAAASFLRGVPFVQIPTSLLSMVDSSVGGKVGVNLPAGKNLVGAFKQPEFVLIDTRTLDTLPEAEKRCGLAEAIKHGFLADPGLLDPARFGMITPDFVKQAVQVKVDVVERDPYEANIRAWLNLGHTFGQAIETVSGYTWRHGEAVAVGMAAAARLAVLYELAGPGLIAQTEDLLTAAGLPIRYQGYDPRAVRAAMNVDKKRLDSKVRFVLLAGAGKPGVYDSVPEPLVMQALEAIRT